MHAGQCLCGTIRFQIDGPLAPVQVCHCTDCRRAQGGPFATNIPVSRANFRWTAGESALGVFESSPGKRRWFCARCASPVYSERDSLPGVLRVRAGLLDEPVSVDLAAHAFAGSRCSWWPITDDLPRFEGFMP